MTHTSAQRSWRVTTLAVVTFLVLISAPRAMSEQASSAVRPAQSGYIDAGEESTCAILADRLVRCWGKGLAGRLGYGSEDSVLTAGGSGPVNLGVGRTARAVVSGDFHTCAILDNGSVRCWGFGANGRLGYGIPGNVLTPAVMPPVDLGAGRTARAITAGASHTCAILDNGSVRCWGNGVSGRLGYGNQASVGDDETPGSVGPVDIGAGRTAVAISAGDFHTCVVRDDAQLVCWGFGSGGQLGYGGTADVGDNETPGSVGPVNLGGQSVRAVSGGKGHTCVVLGDGSGRCWGFGADGRLGYGGTANVATAAAAPAINLGPGRTATSIAAGEAHTCAILDNGTLRCWGFGGNGRLGSNSTTTIGNDPGETPASIPPVDLGPGRTALAITVGFSHTCASLDDGTARCWGFGGNGRLGYGNETSVGDSPAMSILAAGPLPLGGSLAATVADLTLGIAANVGQVSLGGTASVNVVVANGGPDATGAVTVALPSPPGLTYLGAAASQGDFAGGPGVWNIGSLASGSSVSLTVSLRASSPGTQIIAAEVASSSVLDPTSTPGNGAVEDDRAVVSLVVPALAGGPTTNGVRLRPRKLGVKVSRHPKRGALNRLVVSGSLLLPRSNPPLSCGGRVRVRAKAGARIIASGTVTLRSRRGTCFYSLSMRPKKTSVRTLSLSVTFLGTSQLSPRSSRPLRVRVR